MKKHLNRLINKLNIKLSKIKEKQKLMKKQLVFWWKKKKKIEMLNFDEPVKNKIKLEKINKRVKITSMCLASITIIIIMLSLMTGKNVLATSTKRFLNGLGVYTEPVQTVEIESNNYDSPGSWHVDKKAVRTSPSTVQVTFDVNSVMKTENRYKDVILVLDISGSMAGDKLTKAISDSKELVNYLLSNNQNRLALITFDDTSTIVSGFSNDKNDLLTKLEVTTSMGSTNYNAALQNVDTVMSGYQTQQNRDVVTLFLTDGYPNIDIPNQVGTYEMLKDKYPYMDINGIQYEMGIDVIDEITEITDSQWLADRTNLKNVLLEAAVSPDAYEKFIITDYVHNDYFTIGSVNDIKVSKGTVTLEDDSGTPKITWNLGMSAYTTGGTAKMTINLTIKQQYRESSGYYPTNKQERVVYKLPGGTEQTVNSTDTPVLKNKYEVNYDSNTPTGCSLPSVASEEYGVYQNVSKKTTVLSCSGYLFKGWEIDSDDEVDITKVNDDVFIMPEHDVTIRGTWTKQSISKSMDGTVYEKTTLYKVLKNEAESNGLAREYTGSHQDSMDASKSTEKIYHYYASSDAEGTAILNKNNVIFAGHCWQMIRTTDTGGVKLIYNGEAENDQCLNTRGTHVGYGTRTNQNLASPYWYGTDYTYDSVTKEFKVSGTTEQATWDENTGPGLVGKYTCLGANVDDTCSTLYYVESVYDVSATMAKTNAYVISLNSNANYSQFGTLQFNTKYNSPANVGYMNGDVYSGGSRKIKDYREYPTSSQTMLQSTSLNTTFWYSDSVTWGNPVANRYNLDSPHQVSSTADYPNLVGEYTFRNATQTYTTTSIYYIAGVGGNNMYYKRLQSGNLLSAYEPIIFGDSITDNGNGTYTINNPEPVTLKQWFTNSGDYYHKYTCNDSSTTCTNPRYTISTSTTKYTYIDASNKLMLGKTRNGLTLTDTILVRYDELSKNSSNYTDYKYTCGTDSATCTETTLVMIDSYLPDTGYRYAKNYYYGTSVNWDGTNYTLVNPIGLENYNNLNNLSTHHYMCPSEGLKTCPTVDYIYYGVVSSTNFYPLSGISLSNGVRTVDKALEDMLTKNITNSTMKRGVDEWYKHYLLDDYDDYIEDTIFCNDRTILSLGGWNPNGGSVTDPLLFKASNPTTDLSCTNTIDRFSVSNPSAPLTYKVGLISSPELNLLNNKNARKTGQYYFLISPQKYDTYSANVDRVLTDGSMLYGYVNSNYGARPAISLIPGIEYYEGDGSMANPYKVDLERTWELNN